MDGNYVSDPEHFGEDLRSVVVGIQDGKIRARGNDETRPAPGFAPEVSLVQGETTAKAGEKIALHVVVTGEPEPRIQWQRRQSDSETWEPIDGATEAKYEFVATADDNAAQIRAHVHNEHGDAESNLVTLSVEKEPESAPDKAETTEPSSPAEPTESTEQKESVDPTDETKPAEPTEPTDETQPAEPSTPSKPGLSSTSKLGGLTAVGIVLSVFGVIFSQFGHLLGIDQVNARIRDFLSNFGVRF